MTEMETEEHLKKMDALTHIMDPAVKEYLQLLKLQHDADFRFMCQSLNNDRRLISQRFTVSEGRLEALENILKEHAIS